MGYRRNKIGSRNENCCVQVVPVYTTHCHMFYKAGNLPTHTIYWSICVSVIVTVESISLNSTNRVFFIMGLTENTLLIHYKGQSLIIVSRKKHKHNVWPKCRVSERENGRYKYVRLWFKRWNFSSLCLFLFPYPSVRAFSYPLLIIVSYRWCNQHESSLSQVRSMRKVEKPLFNLPHYLDCNHCIPMLLKKKRGGLCWSAFR